MEIQTSPPRAHEVRPAPPAHQGPVPRRGKIEVTTQAIATVAWRAAAEVYGVVGMAAPWPRMRALTLLAPARTHRGVLVRFVDDHVAIELYVVLEYGLRISEIARNLIKDVQYAVEQTLGLPVVEVNVNVVDLRVSGRE
ncbi:MAG: Asp23/Gls24 family envelope stress response protein [Ktedonobacterales bacterium]